jgi:hypothetical protein
MAPSSLPKAIDRAAEIGEDIPAPLPVASTGFTQARALADVGPAAPLTLRTPLHRAPLDEPITIKGEVPDDYVAPQARRIQPGFSALARTPATLPSTPPVSLSPSPSASFTSSSAGSPAANVARQPASIASMASSAPPAVAAPAAATAINRADETRVAQVLNQYARAYGQLDAGAARAVWPSVDERALARAFAGLASQDVSFDSCDIDVRGATANASCRGRAKYVGKIGTREERSESRQWRFELRRDGDAWKIETAEARRLAYQER